MPHSPLSLPPSPDLYAALSPALRLLADRGEPRRFAKGSTIIHEGDRSDTLFIILSGRLRAFSSNTEGREITYGIYGAGEYMGEMSLDGGLRSASVITMEPSICVMVTRETLSRFIAEVPEFAFELLSKVIHRARSVTLSAKTLALNDVYGRLYLLLTQALADAGASGVVERGGESAPLPFTHRDIAAHIGSSREMVSRLLKDLEKGGYIAQQRGSLTVLRPLPPRW